MPVNKFEVTNSYIKTATPPYVSNFSQTSLFELAKNMDEYSCTSDYEQMKHCIFLRTGYPY